ncbi:MAG: UvrD-helicase domain-containing protein [Actinomycetota bacterium]|nr:UvrD-helicase domain-containing protein [Actinomycetota bacterium]MDA8279981.1 UvrD-helicase domain-containing protein [Actinomycetota bacterium]
MGSAGSAAQGPTLAGDALRAVRHRGGHVQIIAAAAGSGKTEVVSQRVADLLADDVAPDAAEGSVRSRSDPGWSNRS